MKTLFFMLIGLISSLTLKSCDVTEGTWQFWVIFACIIATFLFTYFAHEESDDTE